MPKLYMDSCIVIYLFEGSDTIHEKISGMLRSLSSIGMQICISELIRLECRVGPLMENDTMLLKQYDEFFSIPVIQIFPFNREIFDLAIEIRANYKFKTPYALHLATAIYWGCDEFWTNDNRFISITENRIQIVNLFKE